jgi:hypothetical protein
MFCDFFILQCTTRAYSLCVCTDRLRLVCHCQLMCMAAVRSRPQLQHPPCTPRQPHTNRTLVLWLAACSEALHAQPCTPLTANCTKRRLLASNRFVSCVVCMSFLLLGAMCLYVFVPTQIATGSREGTVCSGEVQMTSCQSLGFPHCAPALLEATQVTIAPLCAQVSRQAYGGGSDVGINYSAGMCLVARLDPGCASGVCWHQGTCTTGTSRRTPS